MSPVHSLSHTKPIHQCCEFFQSISSFLVSLVPFQFVLMIGLLMIKVPIFVHYVDTLQQEPLGIPVVIKINYHCNKGDKTMRRKQWNIPIRRNWRIILGYGGRSKKVHVEVHVAESSNSYF